MSSFSHFLCCNTECRCVCEQGGQGGHDAASHGRKVPEAGHTDGQASARARLRLTEPPLVHALADRAPRCSRGLHC